MKNDEYLEEMIFELIKLENLVEDLEWEIIRLNCK